MRKLVLSLCVFSAMLSFCILQAHARVSETGITVAIPFDEGAGDLAADVSGMGNDAILNGTPEWVSGKFGKAIRMDGDDWADAGDDPSRDLSRADFTIVVWVNFEAEQHLTICADDPGGGETNKWIFIYRPVWFPAGGPTFHLNYPDAPGLWVFSPWNGDVGVWYQIGVTKAGTTYTFYVDGEVADVVENDAPFPPSDDVLEIGRAEGGNNFIGIMDEFVIAQRVLSGAEMRSHFADGVPGVVTAVDPAGKAASTWAALKAR